MRVTLCVDALAPNPGGIGRYTWQLCQGLSRRADIDLSYYGRHRILEDPSTLLRGENLPRRRFRRMRDRQDLRVVSRSLFHATNYFLPPAVEGVITVHDLSVFKYPETHPVERIRAFDKEFRLSLQRSKHIITDTETVRLELIDYFGLSPNMVTAVHLGFDDKYHHRSEPGDQAILRHLGLKQKSYGLCVSTLEPRKKVGELVAAWRRLPLEIRDRYPLALAGGKGWLNDNLQHDIDRGHAEGWLHHLGFVQEQMLPALYRGAQLFIYPSVYEGFGLPPLESMACGTPVVASLRSCLPEVCGDAASYIDPENPEQMLASIEQGLTDQAWLTGASERGLLQADKFSWSRCIDETVAVYSDVTGGPVAHRKSLW